MRRWMRVVLLLGVLSLGCLWSWVPLFVHPPANPRKTFGYHRVGILAAQINAITLILVAARVLFEAIQRFQHPEPVTMFVSAGIAIGAWHILRGTTDILLEATPKAINMHGPIADMQTVNAMQDVHDLHVRSITSGIYATSAHVRTANLPLSECAPILSRLETILREEYHVGHTTFQFEYGSNQGTCREMVGLYCQMESNHDHDSAEAVVPHVKKEECV
jgi:Co/Zn/Cd efflux system component